MFCKLVLFFSLPFFSFSWGMQTRERAHCARSVFPFIKKKEKKRQFSNSVLALIESQCSSVGTWGRTEYISPTGLFITDYILLSIVDN